MGLTRPKIWDIDTNIEYFKDPITVLHQGATTANVDVGFLFNRANGLVSNVAVYWSESTQSVVTAFTSNSGVTDSNVTVLSYANLTIGSLFSINGNIYLNGLQGTPGQYITATSSGTAWTSSSFTGGVISSTTYPSANLSINLGTTTGYWANVYTGNLIVSQNVLWANGTPFVSGGTSWNGGYLASQSTFGSNLVANSGVTSTSTTTGALVVSGGAGISGNLYVGGNISATNFLGNVFFGPTPTTTYYNQAPLNLTNSLSGGIKTQLNLINTGGGAGAGAGIDFYTYTSVAGSTYPESRIAAVDDGSYSSYITFQTKIPGNTGANALAERLKIDSAGNIVIPTTTTSTSTTTGALVVAGGVGITGAIYAGSIQGTPIGSTTASTGAFSSLSATSFKTTQTTVTVGASAGLVSQGTYAIAIGTYAGYNTQGAYSVVVGPQAGQNTVGQYSVLAGYNAGFNSTSANVVSIGPYAGYQSAATNSVAIGNQAGYYQTASGIVINATGNQLNGNVAGFVVAPVRNDNGNISLQVAYNTTTNEFTYSNTISVASATIGGNLTVQGNLFVTGTQTFTNTETLLNTEYATTINATNIYSATLGNIGANHVGTGTYLTSLNASNLSSGTISASLVPTLNQNTTGTAATVTTAAQPNITSVGTLTSLTVSGAIVPNANASVTLGSTTAWWSTIYGTAIHAQYADLAENYSADADYPPGTVVVFGGTQEITTTVISHDTAVAGVVSTNPAYLMNGDSPGLPVALTGRVPCQVQGPVVKGQVLVTSNIAGVAQGIDNSKFLPGCVVGKALETINTNTIETIEVVVGRF